MRKHNMYYTPRRKPRRSTRRKLQKYRLDYRTDLSNHSTHITLLNPPPPFPPHTHNVCAHIAFCSFVMQCDTKCLRLCCAISL